LTAAHRGFAGGEDDEFGSHVCVEPLAHGQHSVCEMHALSAGHSDSTLRHDARVRHRVRQGVTTGAAVARGDREVPDPFPKSFRPS
jgi:hypothetical protein